MSRHIDADAYIKYCDEHWIPLNVDAVKAQPTADVRENVRGDWIHISDGYCDFLKCSQCGKATDSKSNYCPNCGAEMKRGNK